MDTLTLTLPADEMAMLCEGYYSWISEGVEYQAIQTEEIASIKHILDRLVSALPEDYKADYQWMEDVYESLDTVRGN